MEQSGESEREEASKQSWNGLFWLQFHLQPLNWVEKRVPIKAYISPAVVGHQEPNYCDSVIPRWPPGMGGRVPLCN
jgi:hypothetical protein